MVSGLPSGPAELVLMASIARRHYMDGKAKTEIADEFGLSRFKVARLIDLARETGLVRIEIGRPGSIDVDLSVALQDEYDLRHAIVVDTPETESAALRRHVGKAAAELLSEVVTTDDVLGLGWARSLIAMRASLVSLAPAPVVQLTGALARPELDDSSVDLVRDVARISKGTAYYFYSPMLVPDAATAGMMLRQPEVARAFNQFSTVTKAVVGIGGWDPPASTLYDALTPSERKMLMKSEVCADVSGVLLDVGGRPLDGPPTDRMVCISAPELLHIPEVIGLVYGPEKAPAARAAIGGGYVNGIVTHTACAQALLSLAQS